ncbi:MAG: FecR domain-containing protein [Lentisphaerae bacterium]|nr:FecR domain-containing protein [Lentisphaerota bacterium]
MDFDPREEFLMLLACVMEQTCTPFQARRLADLMRDHPEFVALYREQIKVEERLRWSLDSQAYARPCVPFAMRPRRPQTQRLTKTVRAVAALAVAGAVCWHTGNWLQRSLPEWRRNAALAAAARGRSAAPVTELERTAALDLPQTLPGTVSLAEGRARLLLPASGVEVALLGPAVLHVRDAIHVTLQAGSLIADVPPRSVGFTVCAPGLEIWDLGTVFGVAVTERGADVFVFKGSVQVNDDTGQGIDLCLAGEGVRSLGPRNTFKVDSDYRDAPVRFAAVQGRVAMSDPAASMKVARGLADGWMSHYAPDTPLSLAAEIQPVIFKKPVPFSKGAWVRPSVRTVTAQPRDEPASMAEEITMKTSGAASVWAAAAVMLGTEGVSALSNEIMVNTSLTQNQRWEAVRTNEVTLAWDWHPQAKEAELSITGMSATLIEPFTEVTSNYLWRVCESMLPSLEDVFELQLTFYADGGAVVGALTSRVALVKGALGQTEVNASPTGTAWNRVKTDVVIPYDAGWAEATADAGSALLTIAKAGGSTKDFTLAPACGFFGWKLRHSEWGYGTFALSLAFPETVPDVWDAMLVRLTDGTLIKMR